MLAFAALFPNFQLLLFFIIPVKIKWLAWLIWAWVGYYVLTFPWLLKGYFLLIYANYFLFFGPEHFRNIKQAIANRQRRKRFREAHED